MGKVFVWLFGIGTVGSLGFLALFRRAIGIVLVMMMGVYAVGQFKGDVIGLIKTSMMNSQENIDKDREFARQKLKMEDDARREQLKTEAERERARTAAEAEQRRAEAAEAKAQAKAEAQAAKAAAQEAARVEAEQRRAEAERQQAVAKAQAEARVQAERYRQREQQAQQLKEQRLAEVQADPSSFSISWKYAGEYYSPNSRTRLFSDAFKYKLYTEDAYTNTKNGIVSEIQRQDVAEAATVPGQTFFTTFRSAVFTLESDCANQRWRITNARYYHGANLDRGLSMTADTDWRSFSDQRPASRACR